MLSSTEPQVATSSQSVLDAQDVNVYYGNYLAVEGVNMTIPKNKVTAMIGPSGCGKSTMLRCFNRMNDLVASARVTGKILYHGQNLYEGGIDPVEVRRRIGIVFQKP
ncbi:MAG: ATP-binding cassette domain-containing protein, partial [Cyanobacteria bacterium P01_G01_bin.4]